MSQQAVRIQFLIPNSILKTRSTLESVIKQIKEDSSGGKLESVATVSIKIVAFGCPRAC